MAKKVAGVPTGVATFLISVALMAGASSGPAAADDLQLEFTAINCSVSGTFTITIADNAVTSSTANCEGTVTIPAEVTSIANGVFEGRRISNLEFAQGSRLETIGDDAFYSTLFTSLTLPPLVSSIGNEAFGRNPGGTALESVAFLGNAPTVGVLPFGSDPARVKVFVSFSATGFDLDQNGLWNGYPVTRAAGPAESTSSTTVPAAVSAIHLEPGFRIGMRVVDIRVLAEGQGLLPGAPYSLILRSTPQTLAGGEVSSSGRFSRVAPLPSEIPAGQHTVTLTAVGSAGETLMLMASFTVDDSGVITSLSPATPTDGARLATTGPEGKVIAQGMLAGGMAMLAGMILLAVRRGLAQAAR